VLGVLVWVVMGSVGSADGYVSASSLNCVNSSQANLSALEGSLAPASGATAQAGTLVTFTGNSEVPLRFAVASSLALLSSPDIDSGPGSARPFSSREPLVDTYTFTSTRAAITPETIYWDASFSNATIAELLPQQAAMSNSPRFTAATCCKYSEPSLAQTASWSSESPSR
jgi:hypothetical protein